MGNREKAIAVAANRPPNCTPPLYMGDQARRGPPFPPFDPLPPLPLPCSPPSSTFLPHTSAVPPPDPGVVWCSLPPP